MYKVKIVIITLIFAALSTTLFLTVFDIYIADKDLEKPIAQTENIRIGIAEAAGLLSSVIIIAQEKNFFLEEGLEANIQFEVSGVQALEKMHEGELDIVTASDFAFVNDSLVRASSTILATIDSADIISVIARRSAGINKPEDIKGKRVAVVPKTAAAYVLARFLSSNNLSSEEITVVNYSFDQLQEAIMNEEVDAVIVNDPWAYDIEKALGPDGVYWSAQYGQDVYFNAISSDGYVAAHTEAVDKFLKALLLSEKFIQQNPVEAKEIVKKAFDFEEAYFDRAWPQNIFSVTLTQELILALESQARWVLTKNNSNVRGVPNYLNRIHIEGLEKINSNAVTIFH